jgi:hypothetical protein
MADGQSFITRLRQTVAAYRSTAHAVTGVSPASVMLAFPFKTPLTALQTQQPASDTSTSKSSTSANIKRRVLFKQEAMAEQHDRRFHAAQPQFRAGDWIRVKLPTREHKLVPVFSEPFEVTRAAGNTVWLKNGKRWNVRRCIRHRSSLKPTTPRPVTPSVALLPQSTANEQEDDLATFSFQMGEPAAAAAAAAEQNGPRRSARVRRPRDFGPVVRH